MTVDYLVPWLNASGQDGLRNSMLVAAGDGVTTMYSINFAGGYISKGDIKAYTFDPVTGTTQTLTITAGMWTGASQITLAAPVPVGQYIVIYRDTQKTTPLVSFVDGAILNEPNLDMLAEQAVFVAAEMADRFDLLNDGSTLAIANSATALSTANTALANSSAAQGASAAAVSTANAASSASGAATSTANAARDTANGIDAKAQSALDASAAAVSTANAASSTANGIDAKAQSALDASASAVSTASAANTKADSATSTANTAKSTADGLAASIATANTNASGAVSTANAAAALPGRYLGTRIINVPGSGTFMPSAGAKTLRARIQGAGGGSGGCSATAGNEVSCSAPGAPGGYAETVVAAVPAGMAYTLGDGGNGGVGGVNSGAAGATTTFAGCTVTGGAGGVSNPSTTSSGTAAFPGVPGTASGGSVVNLTGISCTYSHIVVASGLVLAAQANPSIMGGGQFGFGAAGRANGGSQGPLPGFKGGQAYILIDEYA